MSRSDKNEKSGLTTSGPPKITLFHGFSKMTILKFERCFFTVFAILAKKGHFDQNVQKGVQKGGKPQDSQNRRF